MKGCFGAVWKLTLYGFMIAVAFSLFSSGETGSFWVGILGLAGLVAFYYYGFKPTGLGNKYKSETQHTEDFLNQAKKYQDYTQELCDFYPLENGVEWLKFSKYDGLSKEQLSWYFYWRTQARSGQYLDTSSTHIFMHTYELINGIGITDAMDGYHQLKMLWVNYQHVHSDVRYRLLDWLFDYAVVNDYPENPLFDIWEDVPIDNKLARRYSDMLVQVYQEKDFNQIPFPIISKLMDYRIHKSKFYLDDNQEMMEEKIYKVLSAIDLFLKRSDSGIFQKYQPEKFNVTERFAFRQAIYKKEHDAHIQFPDTNVRLPDIYEWSTHESLRTFLTSIVKYTENLLRKQHNHRGRLRVNGLDPEIQSLIDQTLLDDIPAELLIGGTGYASGSMPIPEKTNFHDNTAKIPVLPKIEIDYERVSQLSQESDEIFEVLDQNEDETSALAESSLNAIRTSGKSSAQTVDEENAVRIELDYDRVQKLQKVSNDVMETLSYDEDNDKVIQSIEKVILDQADGSLTKSTNEFVAMPDVVQSSRSDNLTNDDDEFSQLISSLADMHLDVLCAILQNKEPILIIHQIALQNGTMPAVLVEAINECADEYIGDLLIALEPAPHFIDEEYAIAIEKLLLEET